jgi:uncharacterized Fe-S cluster-containing radical SAM superfamily protein
MIDPIQRAQEVERIVIRDNRRRYYKITHNFFYGSIVSAYTVGCILRCIYCWNYRKNQNPHKFGRFLLPDQVAKKINELSKKHRTVQARITGGEPILGEASTIHLVKIIEKVRVHKFLVETNGVILGYNPDLLEYFEHLKDVVVFRVAVKGYDYSNFQLITDAVGTALDYTFNCIKELSKRKFQFWVCAMPEVMGTRGVAILRRKLQELGYRGHLELETLNTRYPGVMDRIRERGIKLEFGFRDEYVPCKQD